MIVSSNCARFVRLRRLQKQLLDRVAAQSAGAPLTGSNRRLSRRRDRGCPVCSTQERRVWTARARGRRRTAAEQLCRHLRLPAALAAVTSVCTSHVRARERPGAARLCVPRAAARRSLRLPTPRGAGPYCGRRLEGSRLELRTPRHAHRSYPLSRYPPIERSQRPQGPRARLQRRPAAAAWRPTSRATPPRPLAPPPPPQERLGRPRARYDGCASIAV